MPRYLRAFGYVCLLGAVACSVNVQGIQRTQEDEQPSNVLDTNPGDAGDANGTTMLDAQASPAVPDAVPNGGAVPSMPGDKLIGYYAEKRAFRTLQTVNRGGISDVRVLSTSYALVRITREGTRYLFREKGCRVVTENEGGAIPVFVEIKDAVPQKMPEMVSDLRLNITGSSIEWTRPLTSVAVGFAPSDPSDTLPDKPDDPRVRDTDEDGAPGVTAHVKADLGIFSVIDDDIYVVQWNRARYEGMVEASGKFSGENFDSSEQRVIGSTNALLMQPTPISPDPDTADNNIVLLPLAGPIGCDALIAQIATLFP